ncbi:hypothetical protein QJQ45_017074, partial [Haematococcus lacustris]
VLQCPYYICTELRANGTKLACKDPPLPRRRSQEEQPRGAARSGSQEQQLGAAARSGSQEAWARQVVGQGQEAHAPHSQEAQPGGRSSSQQGGSKESAMAHGDNRPCSRAAGPCENVSQNPVAVRQDPVKL